MILFAFCAIRPPGHHATDTVEYGFCFYNNIAIAARYAQLIFDLFVVLKILSALQVTLLV